MIQLSTDTKLSRNTSFYFNNIEDCKQFLEVFEDHWCNVPWATPKVVKESEVPNNKLLYINDNPKIRAEQNLSWGFGLVSYLDRDLTPGQRAFIDNMIKDKG